MVPSKDRDGNELMDYDIIGDIHGQAAKLTALLTRLGYVERGGAYRHPTRHAAFVGDFIDRGKQGLETVQIVRAMVERGSASAVMGNHELNAIAWHTPDLRHPGEFLRPRYAEPWGSRNRYQHDAFLAQVEAKPVQHAELVNWFLTLPLWLELPELRIVHACWHAPMITWLATRLHQGCYLTRELMVDAMTEPETLEEKDSAVPSTFKAIEALTKGIELQLPATGAFLDKDGIRRTRVRSRWWDQDDTSYRGLANLSAGERQLLPDQPVPVHMRPSIPNDRPVFFGHYWMTGVPSLQSPHTACVDYSAGKGGALVAYRHDAGAPLTDQGFVWVA